MKKLPSIKESLNIISESHVDTDKMKYADAIAKAIQAKKTELNHLFQAEIVDSTSDFESGNGGGRLKVTKPAVPDEVEFHVSIENRKSPTPTIGEDGTEIPGEGEETGDVCVSVSINDGKAEEEKFKGLNLAELTPTVVAHVMAVVDEYYQKQKGEGDAAASGSAPAAAGKPAEAEGAAAPGTVATSAAPGTDEPTAVANEAKRLTEAVARNKARKAGKVNEDTANLQAVAAGIAAVVASGVGIAGLMEYLKTKHPKVYAALSKAGVGAASGRKNYTADEAKINEASADLGVVAAGIAAIIGSGVGIAGLMEYLKEHNPKVYAALTKAGSSAASSRKNYTSGEAK